jgi:hypothetical protein
MNLFLPFPLLPLIDGTRAWVKMQIDLYAFNKKPKRRTERDRRSTRSARRLRASLRFCSRERVSWHCTRMPVGRCIREHEIDVLLIDCPPGPEPVRVIRD